MWKSIARATLATMARSLPWGARRALLEAMLNNFGYLNVFQELGGALRVESVRVNASNGLLWGSINDREALGRYMTDGAWAATTVGLFAEFFESSGGGTFLDIGANLGLTLVPIARNREVQCYGFEPEPRNFSYLKQNIEENCPHGNVLLEKLALFDCKDILEFELSPVNFGDHRVRTTGVNGVYQEGARMTISVAADRLDSVMQVHALKQPIAVKIDTQGAEAKIFSGGQKVLSGASLIALEFWPYGMRRVGGDVEAWIEFLGSNFREGSIAEGDTDTPPRWRPIPAIVRELHELWAESPASVGRRYVDVIVRR